MKRITKTSLKKYISLIKKEKKKIVTCEDLSSLIGVYPEVIAEQLSYFEPMLLMDYSYNLKDLLTVMEQYLCELEKSNKPTKPIQRISKKELIQYDSLAMFVFEKMTSGGIVDRYAKLSDHDLKILKKLVIKEEKERKKSKK